MPQPVQHTDRLALPTLLHSRIKTVCRPRRPALSQPPMVSYGGVLCLRVERRKGDNDKPCVMLDLSQTQDGIPVADIFGTFDAKKAQCHEMKDRDHLLAIIESSFGSLRRFRGSCTR